MGYRSFYVQQVHWHGAVLVSGFTDIQHTNPGFPGSELGREVGLTARRTGGLAAGGKRDCWF